MAWKTALSRILGGVSVAFLAAALVHGGASVIPGWALWLGAILAGVATTGLLVWMAREEARREASRKAEDERRHREKMTNDLISGGQL